MAGQFGVEGKGVVVAGAGRGVTADGAFLLEPLGPILAGRRGRRRPARSRGRNMIASMRYGQGDFLSYADYGSRGGRPILVQHGMVASIEDTHLFDRAVGAGRRLVCAARPGYGGSSPRRMADVAEWGEIVSLLADELGLADFDVLGISSGAPYAYSIGYALRDRVRRVYVFSGTPALFDESVAALWPYELPRGAGIDELRVLAERIFFSGLSSEDSARADVRDSRRNGCFGPALDLGIRCQDWGFPLSGLGPKVVMQHCRADEQVPYATAVATARLLPGCELQTRERGGHFSAGALDAFVEASILRDRGAAQPWLSRS